MARKRKKQADTFYVYHTISNRGKSCCEVQAIRGRQTKTYKNVSWFWVLKLFQLTEVHKDAEVEVNRLGVVTEYYATRPSTGRNFYDYR